MKHIPNVSFLVVSCVKIDVKHLSTLQNILNIWNTSWLAYV